MKKFFGILLIIILVIIAALIVTPLLFREQIFQKAKEVANTSVNAKVDFQDFRLSLFKNFPRLTVTLTGVSVANLEPFEGDTLVAFDEFSASVDLLSVIKKESIKVRGILLDHPRISAFVLKDGTANWNIAKESEVEEEETDTAASGTMDLNVALKKFEIRQAYISYKDDVSDMNAALDNFNFLLSGDLSQDFSSLKIKSNTEKVNFVYGGIRYVTDALLNILIDLDADLVNSVFTLKNNSISVNDLELNFDGMVTVPDEETISVDMTFNTPKTDFKSLLSMVPAVYMKDFSDIETSGKLGLSGYVKGKQTEVHTPSAGLELLVEDASFSYPDLPKSAENININVNVNYDGVQNDNSTIDVNRFHIELGGNPVDFNMHMITPISDPQVNARLTADVDFASLVDVVPMEEADLQGKLSANVTMMGKMSSIEQEEYEDFQANGMIELAGFLFDSPDLPQKVNIDNTTLLFSPQFVELEKFDATIGSSDLHLKGKLENFIPYMFSDGVVSGALNFTSDLLDLNEFITEGEEVEETEEDTIELKVIEVPGNVAFRLSSRLSKVIYDRLEIGNILGLIEIKDKKILLTNLSMDLLDGSMMMAGEYNTQDITTPMVDFKLNVTKIDIHSAFEAFNTVQQLAPAAENASGKVSTMLEFTTFLDDHMNPVMNSLVGQGRLMSNNIQVDNSRVFDRIGSVLKSDKFKTIAMNDVDLNFEVRDGRIYVEPFDTKIGSYTFTIQGDQGIDQTMNYLMAMKIPRSDLGSGVGSALNELTSVAAAQGINLDPGNEIDIRFLVTGTFKDPDVKPVFGKGERVVTQQVKEQVQERVEEKVEEVKEEMREEINKEAEKILKEAEEEAEKVREQARKTGEELIRIAEEDGQKRIKDAGNNPIKKRLAEEYAKRVKKEAEDKAKKLEEEADQKANNIIEKARQEGDKLK